MRYHSTELAAVELVDRITQPLEQKKASFSAYIDLSKAFDTLNHDILSAKLELYGVHRNSISFIENYLCYRK